MVQFTLVKVDDWLPKGERGGLEPIAERYMRGVLEQGKLYMLHIYVRQNNSGDRLGNIRETSRSHVRRRMRVKVA